MPNRPRAKMPVYERAKQFSSFKALSGLEEALEQKRRELGFEEKRILSDDDERMINETLSSLKKGDVVIVEFFTGREYLFVCEAVREIDEIKKVLSLEKHSIPFGNIFSLNIPDVK